MDFRGQARFPKKSIEITKMVMSAKNVIVRN